MENRGILLKVTTRKITGQKWELLYFVRPLMTAGLPLMKCVLTSIAKNVLILLELASAIQETDASIRKIIIDQ